MSSSENEKRRFCRVSFLASGSISLETKEWKCCILDISLKGVLLESPQDFEVKKDTLYRIRLILNEDTMISMQAKLMHSEAHHLGFQWIYIDLDSLTNLRRLLELNLHNDQEINRELSDLVHNFR